MKNIDLEIQLLQARIRELEESTRNMQQNQIKLMQTVTDLLVILANEKGISVDHIVTAE